MSKLPASGRRAKGHRRSSVSDFFDSPSTRKDTHRAPFLMKMRWYLLVSGFAWFAIPAHGQEFDLRESSAPASPTRILGSITDGTKPEEDADLPGFKVRSRDILSTRIQVEDGGTVTVHEIKPVALAEPLATGNMEGDDTAPMDGNSAEEENAGTTGTMLLSATVYRFSNGTMPRSHVRYWPDGAKEPVHLWSSADFALIAGGIHSFVDSKGATHALMLAWSETELTRLDEIRLEGEARTLFGKIPNLADEPASFHTVGPEANEEILLPIRSLHDLYNSNREALQKACQARKEAEQRRDAASKAEQSAPRNITLHYWRKEIPSEHKENGGER